MTLAVENHSTYIGVLAFNFDTKSAIYFEALSNNNGRACTLFYENLLLISEVELNLI